MHVWPIGAIIFRICNNNKNVGNVHGPLAILKLLFLTLFWPFGSLHCRTLKFLQKLKITVIITSPNHANASLWLAPPLPVWLAALTARHIGHIGWSSPADK